MSEYWIEIHESFSPGTHPVEEFHMYAGHSALSIDETWILKDSDGKEVARYEEGELIEIGDSR